MRTLGGLLHAGNADSNAGIPARHHRDRRLRKRLIQVPLQTALARL